MDSYPDLQQVMEVVPDPDRDLAGSVALVRLVIGVDAEHLHRSLPPAAKENRSAELRLRFIRFLFFFFWFSPCI